MPVSPVGGQKTPIDTHHIHNVNIDSSVTREANGTSEENKE